MDHHHAIDRIESLARLALKLATCDRQKHALEHILHEAQTLANDMDVDTEQA